MKIKVVSSSAQRAEQVAQIVRGSEPGLDVAAATQGPGGLQVAVNGSRPGLLVLDGIDLPGLEAINHYTQAHPEVETIIISSEQSSSFFLKAMQCGVREVLPAPADGPALQAAVQRLTRKCRPTAAAAPLGEVLAFMACKGGSGASFLAANLAHILSARDGRSVALLDLDLQFGDALMMVSDQRPVSDVAEVARNISRLDADLLRSAMVQVTGTLSVLPAPEELSQALEVKAAHLGAIIKQAQQMFNFVVLDVGRSIDVLSLQALDLATHIFPIVQLSLPQVRDAKRLRGLFRSLEYSEQKIHWLVNRYQKTSEITLESLAQTLSTKGIKTIPNHFSSVSASVNQGVPIDKLSRNNPVARALLELAQSVAPVEGARKDRWLSGLFGNA